MPTAGYSGPFDSWFISFANGTPNQYATRVVLPEAGTISDLSAYFAGDSGAVNAALCLWAANGTLLRQSAQFSAAAGGNAFNTQAWHTRPITSYSAAAGTELYVGFWRDPNGRVQLSYKAGSGTAIRDNPTKNAPSNLTTAAIAESGGAYVTYTTTGTTNVFVRVANAWDGKGIAVQQNGVKRAARAYVRAGGAWKP